jgi:hypothetical protein
MNSSDILELNIHSQPYNGLTRIAICFSYDLFSVSSSIHFSTVCSSYLQRDEKKYDEATANLVRDCWNQVGLVI